jgi:hypothetical protein
MQMLVLPCCGSCFALTMGVTIQDSDGRTALKHLEEEMRPNKMKSNARMQR